MRLRSSTSFGALLGLWAIGAAPSGGETFWTNQYGKIAAFELDFTSGAAEYVMQASGDVTLGHQYFALAPHPHTGELWVYASEFATSRQILGRLPPGRTAPVGAVELPPAYFFLHAMEFAADGTLYALLFENTEFRQVLAVVDPVSGLVDPIFTFDVPDSPHDFALDPVSGDLYLTGQEDCDTGCTLFVDRVTVPGHRRERLLSHSFFGPASPLFDESGSLLLEITSFYRLENGALAYLGQPPRVESPFGPFYTDFDGGVRAAGTVGCVPSPWRACLQLRRFAIDVSFDATIFGGPTGSGEPRLVSDESVAFSFFDEAILELFVKVVDGCGFNGHYWVYASGLTNVGVSLVLTDEVGATVYRVENPPGQPFAPVLDIDAFPCGE
jgi:hypothetical protein